MKTIAEVLPEPPKVTKIAFTAEERVELRKFFQRAVVARFDVGTQQKLTIALAEVDLTSKEWPWQLQSFHREIGHAASGIERQALTEVCKALRTLTGLQFDT